MNFTKDIYLNTDKIYENSSLIILYNGMLSKAPDNKVFLHYGYNDTWDKQDELKLKRTDSGMLGVLRVSAGNNFQFVFRDDKNGWDNNNNANYILPILEKEDTVLEFGPSEIAETESETVEESSLLESSVYASDDFEFENTYSVQTSSIPHNTLVNKLEFDNFTNTYFIKPQVINNPVVKEVADVTLEDSFVTFGEMETKTEANEAVNTATPTVSQEVKEVSAEAKATTTALVSTKDSKLSVKSSFYMFKKRVKLAFLKLVKLVKTAFNYNESNN